MVKPLMSTETPCQSKAYISTPCRTKGYNILHAMPSDESVLKGIGQCVAAVQGTGDIRRRQGDNEGPGRISALLAGLRLEEAAFLPPLVPGSLDSTRVVRGKVRVFKGVKNLLLAGSRVVLEGRKCRSWLDLRL